MTMQLQAQKQNELALLGALEVFREFVFQVAEGKDKKALCIHVFPSFESQRTLALKALRSPGVEKPVFLC